MRIRTILFPTDFSDNAINALQYVTQLAKKFNSAIVLFHSFHMPVIKTDVPIEIMEKEMNEMEKLAKEKLAKLADQIKKQANNLDTINIVRRGFTVENILNILEEEHIDLVVMGTKGAGGIKEVIMGSNTADVIERASCPVLAVPEQAQYNGLKKIIYAVDHNHIDCDSIEVIVRIAQVFEAELRLLSISKDDETEKLKQQLKNEILKKINYPQTFLHIIDSDKVLDGINEFAEKEQIDLLVMATRKRHLIEKMFKVSLTRKMAFHGKLPLLAFHQE
ncbi:MAG: universal stress protein [Cytophagaceae bacterium]